MDNLHHDCHKYICDGPCDRFDHASKVQQGDHNEQVDAVATIYTSCVPVGSHDLADVYSSLGLRYYRSKNINFETTYGLPSVSDYSCHRNIAT